MTLALYTNTMVLAIYSMVLGLAIIVIMSLGYFSIYMVMSDDVVTICSIMGFACIITGFVMLFFTIQGVNE